MYCEHLAAVGRERGITADDYQRAALRTAQVTTLMDEDLLLNGVMGLCGEAGECIDLVKKVRFQGHELNAEKLAEELGDVAWYLAVAAHGAGFRLSEVFEANIDKLKRRYPDGFDKARSMNRAGEGTE
jgi:NTP pyrophosphatase (non-canonical NTP hydrolase)